MMVVLVVVVADVDIARYQYQHLSGVFFAYHGTVERDARYFF